MNVFGLVSGLLPGSPPELAALDCDSESIPPSILRQWDFLILADGVGFAVLPKIFGQRLPDTHVHHVGMRLMALGLIKAQKQNKKSKQSTSRQRKLN